MLERASPYRVMFKFWLNIAREEEKEIAETIQALKQDRSFSSVIRDGIRLVWDLRQGRTEVLRELFPWVLENTSPRQLEAPKTGDFTPIESRLQDRFDQIERLLLTSGDKPPNLKTHSMQAPSDDHILANLEIKKARSDENPTFNIMLSSLGMGILKIQDLPLACIEYGLKKGRLPQSAEQYIKAKTPPLSPAEGPKAMDVPQFEPPSFDDLL